MTQFKTSCCMVTLVTEDGALDDPVKGSCFPIHRKSKKVKDLSRTEVGIKNFQSVLRVASEVCTGDEKQLTDSIFGAHLQKLKESRELREIFNCFVALPESKVAIRKITKRVNQRLIPHCMSKSFVLELKHLLTLGKGFSGTPERIFVIQQEIDNYYGGKGNGEASSHSGKDHSGGEARNHPGKDNGETRNHSSGESSGATINHSGNENGETSTPSEKEEENAVFGEGYVEIIRGFLAANEYIHRKLEKAELKLFLNGLENSAVLKTSVKPMLTYMIQKLTK